MLWLFASVMALQIADYLDPFKGSLLTPIMIPRVPGSENATIVRNFITSHFEDLGWTVEHDKFTADTPTGKLEMANILVSKGANPRYTLAAHYDSKMHPEGFVGAIDSAVPCALLLYLAQALPTLEDVEFVFFDGEEAIVEWTDTDSIYGARYHAETRPLPNFLVLLDLLGHKSGPIPSWFADTHDEFAKLEAANQELGEEGKVKYRLVGGELHAHAGAMLDDHIPFWKKGVPCLHLIPSQFPETWHTINDDAEHLDWDFIEAWALILQRWLEPLAKSGHDEL